MRVEVRLPGRDEALRTYVEQRLFSSIGHLERRLKGLTVCVSRSPDRARHRCRMLAQPLPWMTAAVEEEGADVYLAVDRAADRLARALHAALPA